MIFRIFWTAVALDLGAALIIQGLFDRSVHSFIIPAVWLLEHLLEHLLEFLILWDADPGSHVIGSDSHL